MGFEQLFAQLKVLLDPTLTAHTLQSPQQPAPPQTRKRGRHSTQQQQQQQQQQQAATTSQFNSQYPVSSNPQMFTTLVQHQQHLAIAQQQQILALQQQQLFMQQQSQSTQSLSQGTQGSQGSSSTVTERQTDKDKDKLEEGAVDLDTIMNVTATTGINLKVF